MPSTSNYSATPTSDEPSTPLPLPRPPSPPAGHAPRLSARSTLATLASLQGCVALLGAGAVAGGLSLNDRRTGGTQIEDQSIELKSGGRIRDAIGDKAHINVTSYNRIALLTGEVPTEADKAAVEKAIAGIEGVTQRRQRARSGRQQHDQHALQRHRDHHAREERADRRQGRAVQRHQGGHRARQRLPDGPRHASAKPRAPPRSRAPSPAC